MAGWRLFGSAGVFNAGAAPGAREGRRPRQAEELDVPKDSARRWVKPADPDAVRWTNGLHRPSARSGGAGPSGPAAEAGTGDAASSGLSMRGLQRTERQRSGGSAPGLTAAGRPATVCSTKVGFAPLAPCGRLPPRIFLRHGATPIPCLGFCDGLQPEPPSRPGGDRQLPRPHPGGQAAADPVPASGGTLGALRRSV